jgi:AraC-like DNA-binding protein
MMPNTQPTARPVYQDLKQAESRLRRARTYLQDAARELQTAVKDGAAAGILTREDIANELELEALDAVAGKIDSYLARIQRREVTENIIERPEPGRAVGRRVQL